ncbi:UBN2 domain-containing protein [Senna tora]|uniref:UBN2 domain-containing protein n=1 Tax=Senna tora TaxID=362788 RepID=A0A834WD33_9FABA|nr:UBN2 domain-containing protein [Senna tora]
MTTAVSMTSFASGSVDSAEAHVFPLIGGNELESHVDGTGSAPSRLIGEGDECRPNPAFQERIFTNLFAVGNGLLKFNGMNYVDWSEQIQFQLGAMDLDLAIVSEKPAAITETSVEGAKSLYEAWKRSNRLSLNLMKMMMAKNVKPSMSQTDNAKKFMIKIKEYSQSDITDKSIVSSLMSELTTKKFEWSQPIHDHVTSMANLAAKLKSMGIDVSESFLVQFIINSLPLEFGQFQINYNTIKEKWNFQEIKAKLVQEEGRLKKIKDHYVHFTFHKGATSSKPKPAKKDKKRDKATMKVNEGQNEGTHRRNWNLQIDLGYWMSYRS